MKLVTRLVVRDVHHIRVTKTDSVHHVKKITGDTNAICFACKTANIAFRSWNALNARKDTGAILVANLVARIVYQGRVL